MARSAKKTQTDQTKGDLGFEAKLWAAADALRGTMDAAECKHVVDCPEPSRRRCNS